jgi:hypothetical protein
MPPYLPFAISVGNGSVGWIVLKNSLALPLSAIFESKQADWQLFIALLGAIKKSIFRSFIDF